MKLFLDSFKMHATYGFPLIEQLNLAKPKGLIISLPHFQLDALADGWKFGKTRSVILNSLNEIESKAVLEKTLKEVDDFSLLLSQFKKSELSSLRKDLTRIQFDRYKIMLK